MAPYASLPVGAAEALAAAALKVLCPDTNSGNGGVTDVGFWYGCHYPPAMDWLPASGPAQARTAWPRKGKRTALIGTHVVHRQLAVPGRDARIQ